MPKLNLMNPLFFFYLSFFFFYLLSSSLNVGGAADGRPWFTPKAFVGGAAVADENSFTPKAFVSRYWNKQMANGMQMANGPPWFLLNKASPLTAEESATFSKLADEDQNALSTRLQSFCSSANLLCFSAIDKYVANYGTHPLAVNTYTCTFSYTCGGKAVNKSVEPGLFFRERMLKTGTVMPMPDIRDKMPKRSFLPRAISSKLPFSMSKLPEMNRFFHAGENSSMDSMFASVVSECERAPNAGETKRCVRSIEDMIDFSISVLGRNLVVRTTENTEGSSKDVMIGKVSRVNGGKVTMSVSCHPRMFPYLLYYCHSVPNVRVYEADILDPKTKAKVNHGVAICHVDTSSWSENHTAFTALDSGPGKIEVCHWIPENHMSWVTAD